jgi:AraC-like DNA-binding protein
MKEKDAYTKFDLPPVVLYVEKEDGSYGRIESVSYLTDHYLDDYFDKIKKWDNDLKEQLDKGEISPIYYYMIMLEFGEGDLASRVGISRRKLKKHFKMQVFEKMSLKMLKVYADVFDVPVSNMLHFIVINEKDQEKLKISYQKSNNPYITISKIETS